MGGAARLGGIAARDPRGCHGRVSTAPQYRRAEAAGRIRALQARLLVPIHYNRTFEHPRYDRLAPDARERIEAFASERDVRVGFLDPGDWYGVGLSVEPA